MAAKKKPAKKAAKKKSAKKVAKKPAKKPAKKKPAKKPAAKKPAAPADPKVQQIQAIVDVMTKAGVVELETDDGKGGLLRLRFKEDQPQMVSAPMAMPAAAPAPAPVAAPAAAAAPAPAAEPVEEGEAIPSPMVGSFYRAPSPEAEPFVSVGDVVDENTTLCLIEAMKVMNEIKAEMNGKIIEILVENGEPVEFGQPLFRVARN